MNRPCPICGDPLRVVESRELAEVRVAVAECRNPLCEANLPTEPPILSTGQPSTLGAWRINCAALFGDHSPATLFLDARIRESRRGGDEVVLADEQQLLGALVFLHSEKVGQS